MTRTPSPTDICAFCDEFSAKLAAPEYRKLGLGLCQVSEPGKALVHVAWNGDPCISHRVDRQNLAARREFVEKQRAKQEAG
jgi:hypothetical protein